MGRLALYGAFNRAELWSMRLLTLAAAWAALALFVPTATPIEILWTEIAFIGLVYACKVVALRWDIERLRAARGLDGELKLISRGHLVLRGRDVAVQAINLGIGAAALLTEEPAREDVSVLAIVTTLGLIGVGLLTAAGCWYAERNLAQMIARQIDSAGLAPAIEEGEESIS
jgi:hypothetical protein